MLAWLTFSFDLTFMVLVESRFDSFDLSEEEWPPPSVSDFSPVREALLAVPHTHHTVALVRSWDDLGLTIGACVAQLQWQ